MLFRRAADLDRQRYVPAHPNPRAPRGLQGEGGLEGTWLFNEEPASPEGLLTSGIEVVMDSTLDPGASIGLHLHDRTEEFYYVIDGDLTVTAVSAEGNAEVETLGAGDVHFLPVGLSHSAQAGEAGARIFVVAAIPR